MIVTRLKGGLGNQMFQYAAGRRLALTVDTDLVVDLSWLYGDGRHATTPHVYELGAFRIEGRLSYASLAPRALAWRRPRTRMRGGRRTGLIRQRTDLKFDPAVLGAANGTYLDGYWQSADYFSDVEARLRRDFEFAEPPDPVNAHWLARIGSDNAVSLHVRRGDYVTSASAAATMGAVPMEYYRTAITDISERLDRPSFYVFSDDIDFCRAALSCPRDLLYVDVNDSAHGVDDMRLMSACKHHIIANSSFSWWAAWLSCSAGRIVYAPRQWFKSASLDSSRVVPAGWVRW